MERPIRLALVDDHNLYRFALSQTLRSKGFEIVAEGADAREVFAEIDRTAPDVVLLDLKLPLMDGVTAMRELRARSEDLKVMVVTASESPRDVTAAWSAGAHGYVTKMVPFEMLVDGVYRVMAGERFIQPGLVVEDEEGSEDPLSPLSHRERDVFRLIVHGLTSMEIATQLCISVKTVETHRERILKKLDLHSAVQLVRFAAANGLLDS